MQMLYNSKVCRVPVLYLNIHLCYESRCIINYCSNYHFQRFFNFTFKSCITENDLSWMLKIKHNCLYYEQNRKVFFIFLTKIKLILTNNKILINLS